jgi:hypothetical protein
LNPRCKEDVYIDLPSEAGVEENQCGKLEFWLYGFRKAAQEWENLYAEKLEAVGFRRGVRSPVVFSHEDRDLAGVVHGDDFEGSEDDLRWIAAEVRAWFDVKVKGILGPSVKELNVLGRTIL